MLAQLGIPPEQERLYELLINRPGSSAADIAEAAGITAERAGVQLEEMAARGLVVGEPPLPFDGAAPQDAALRTYRASSPSIALTPLLVRQRTSLDHADATVTALTEQFRSASSRAAGGVVEVVSGPVAVRHRLEQLLGGSRREVLMFLAKSVIAVERGGVHSMEYDALLRGVDFRAVITRSHLEVPGMWDDVREVTGLGMKMRVADEIPMRLIVSDRANAMVPLSLADEPGLAETLVVHGTGLVHALVLLFEHYWERAQPMSRSGEGPGPPGTRHGEESAAPRPSEQDRQILALLALDLSDRTIAAQLDLSLRTVERKIRALMDLASAGSRFQLGVEAVTRGWLKR
ncbi:TrmB family transcriptional regulator [Streptomyces sp. NBC_00344]|uniref:TrmB family transcriptional regulator n=1 Tax=Streptomyces sp. NBC_00344 TaxID=2975720 RepID=UPI002E240B2A